MSAARFWRLKPGLLFLNHGSYGSCPAPVLRLQARLREELERQPVRFFGRELEPRLDLARKELASFVGCDDRDLAFVPNATAGVNTILRSLRWEAGDELLVTDHAYNACRNALDFAAARFGAKVVVVRLPFPLDDAEEVVTAILSAVTARTRLALVDHVTSPTGLVLPVARVVAALAKRGVDALVDGAHAPGMVELDLSGLNAAYYAGNCHKWLCAPKGAGFLFVREDRQERVAPLAISHGANSPRRDRTRFRLLFDWTGTDDPTPYLCVPAALKAVGELRPGGWKEHRRRNRKLALEARRLLCRALDIPPPAPESMIGALAALPLPDSGSAVPPGVSEWDPLHDALLERGIEVPVWAWPKPPRRILRVSAQAYNELGQYEELGKVLRELLKL